MSDTDALIIGAGISGLSVAWGLAREGVRVEVWESADRPGGKIRSRREQGYLTERSAALLLNFRPEVDSFVRDAGLLGYKVGRDEARRGRRYLVQDGRLRAVPSKLSKLVFSPLWSWSGKLRMLSEVLVPSHAEDGESVARFIRRRLGREMLEKAIDPFVAGTLASDPEAAEACSALPRLTALEQRYGSITMGVLINRMLRRKSAHVSESFSFEGGMERLVVTLARTPGVRLRTGHAAVEIVPERNRWRVTGRTSAGDVCVRARRLVLSTPAPAASRLLAPLDQGLAELLGGIRYAPLAVVHMGMDREQIGHPLDGVGFLVPKRERLSFNGNLWLDSLFPDRAPEGRALLTSYMGGARHPERAEWDDERLVDALVADMERLLGLSGVPDFLKIDRHARALPLYHGSYSARQRAVDRCLRLWPGLHLAANYRGGVSVRDRIVQGMKTAARVAEALAEDNRPPVFVSASPAVSGPGGNSL